MTQPTPGFLYTPIVFLHKQCKTVGRARGGGNGSARAQGTGRWIYWRGVAGAGGGCVDEELEGSAAIAAHFLIGVEWLRVAADSEIVKEEYDTELP